jgi:formylmethanofuran dehydrogenase subunit E
MNEDDFYEDETDEDEVDKREVLTTCDRCDKALYENDNVWGNNQIGVYCEECAYEEFAEWWYLL